MSGSSPPVDAGLEALDSVVHKGLQELRWGLVQGEEGYACGEGPLHPLHDHVPSVLPEQCYKEGCLPIRLHMQQRLSSRCLPAQHSTAQHSTAQHGTARYSTLQHSPIETGRGSMACQAIKQQSWT